NPLDVLNQPADVSYVLTEVLGLDERAGDPLRAGSQRRSAGSHPASPGAGQTPETEVIQARLYATLP
ncbi:hypothetical protein ACFW18_03325, partial [Micromonospora echinospora]